jgi:hypothetical protein
VTDDLVKRLREEINVFGCPTIRRNPDGREAADRIEQLEGALIAIIITAPFGEPQEIARAALGEKKDD